MSRIEPSRRILGLITRRERWGLTWVGWLALIGLGLLILFSVCRTIYPFLSITDPVPSRIMVIEGWIPKFAMEKAAVEFSRGNYERAFTTGGPVQGSGGYINDYNTTASVGAGLLRKAGVPAEAVQIVPTREMRRDRTYSSAVALRDWFLAHALRPTAFNVVTEGPHARRTRLLYEKAFGNGVKVGIIAAQSPDYDPQHWWRYSEGVKDIESEALGYLYARLLFSPSR